MLIISAEEMKKVLSMKEAIEAVKKAYITLARGNSIVPLRTNITVKKHNGQIDQIALNNTKLTQEAVFTFHYELS